MVAILGRAHRTADWTYRTVTGHWSLGLDCGELLARCSQNTAKAATFNEIDFRWPVLTHHRNFPVSHTGGKLTEPEIPIGRGFGFELCWGLTSGSCNTRRCHSDVCFPVICVPPNLGISLGICIPLTKWPLAFCVSSTRHPLLRVFLWVSRTGKMG